MDENLRRKERAERLIIRTVFERQSLDEAWYEVVPHSKCSRESAKQQARREIEWHRELYPPDLDTCLYLYGLDLYSFAGKLKELTEATLLDRVVTKERIGATVRTTTTHVLSDIPDAKIQLGALKVWKELLNFEPGQGGLGLPLSYGEVVSQLTHDGDSAQNN